MWPNAEKTKDMLEAARAGDPGAVDHLLAEFREPLRRMVDLQIDLVLGRLFDATASGSEVCHATRAMQNWEGVSVKYHSD